MTAPSAPRLPVVAGLDVVETTARRTAEHAREIRDRHHATCLPRRQRLVCSTCFDFEDRAIRAGALARRAAVRP